MNKFFKIFFVAVFAMILSDCHKTEDVTVIPLVDYDVQYGLDMITIETYLKTHTYTVDSNYNVTFAPTTNQSLSIWGSGADPNPNVLSRIYTSTSGYGSQTYKIYYIMLNQGTGDSPCNVDNVVVNYQGTLMPSSNLDTPVLTGDATNNTVFDYSNNGQSNINLATAIRGWSEILPQFKAAGSISYDSNNNVSFSNFGAGIMFIPSGLAYYQNGAGLIPSYTPIKFTFKLIKVYRNDQDGDGIPSYLEDIGGPGDTKDSPIKHPDGYLYNLDSGVSNIDDSDGDEIPDYLDTDDDGDGYLTKTETKKPNGSSALDGPSLYYPYDPTATELRGIPSYSETGNPDYTSPGRLRIHLDNKHHTATP